VRKLREPVSDTATYTQHRYNVTAEDDEDEEVGEQWQAPRVSYDDAPVVGPRRARAKPTTKQEYIEVRRQALREDLEDEEQEIRVTGVKQAGPRRQLYVEGQYVAESNLSASTPRRQRMSGYEVDVDIDHTVKSVDKHQHRHHELSAEETKVCQLKSAIHRCA
jgi:hypothetical protein